MLSMTNDRSATATFALQPRCVVPKVVGLTLKRAKTRIVKARCKVGRVARKTSAKMKKGRVVAQKPKPGKRLAKDAKVNLIVGKGPRR